MLFEFVAVGLTAVVLENSAGDRLDAIRVPVGVGKRRSIYPLEELRVVAPRIHTSQPVLRRNQVLYHLAQQVLSLSVFQANPDWACAVASAAHAFPWPAGAGAAVAFAEEQEVQSFVLGLVADRCEVPSCRSTAQVSLRPGREVVVVHLPARGFAAGRGELVVAAQRAGPRSEGLCRAVVGDEAAVVVILRVVDAARAHLVDSAFTCLEVGGGAWVLSRLKRPPHRPVVIIEGQVSSRIFRRDVGLG
eukprot:2206148-Rhodomonas_salina.3